MRRVPPPDPRARCSTARAAAALIAPLAALSGLALAAIHPLSAPTAALAFILVLVATAWRPAVVPFAVPALLPVLALAPWSGWIVIEELDLLVLAVAAGAYGRRALATDAPRVPAGSPWSRLFVGLFACSVLLALWRGIDDAGGIALGVFQGYYDPLNSLRLAKGFLLAGLLMPIYRRAFHEHAELAARRLATALLAGLAAAALAVVWERAAYTSLLDFSSDYRATGSFWEMHVGGATLDGYLALVLPLAFWAVASARSTPARLGAALVVGAAGYACFVTFSRSIYLAVPLSLLALAWALRRTRPAPADSSAEDASHPAKTFGLGAGFAVAAAASFGGGGYRGLGALSIGAGLVLALGALGRRRRLPFGAAGVAAAAASALLIGTATVLPKGPYVVFTLAAVLTALALRRALRTDWAYGPLLATAGTWTSLVLAVAVGRHWGDGAGLAGMAIAVGVVLALLAWQLAARHPVWPGTPAALANLGLGALVLAASVAVFSGGAYMSERFATSSQDLLGRLDHWRLGAGLLQSPADWAFGKGLGRFPASYLYALPDGEFPGGYRVKDDAGEPYLRLTGSRRPIGFGEILRVSQRLDYAPAARHVVAAEVRTAREARLQVEICEKHLLYADRCASRQLAVKPADGAWHPVSATLDTTMLDPGPWYAPRHLVFSVGAESVSAEFDIGKLRLSPDDGPNILRNGDFSDDLARWFFSSDRVHLPWHIKNLYANVLFDQGLFGLAAFLLLVGRALWRLGLGRARRHPLAPPLLAGLLGFLVVGLFDSLIDAARLNFMFWLLVLLALAIAPPHPRSPHV